MPDVSKWTLHNPDMDGEIILYKYSCLDNVRLYFRFGVYDYKKQSVRHLDTHIGVDHPRVGELHLKGLFTYSESLLLLGVGDTY